MCVRTKAMALEGCALLIRVNECDRYRFVYEYVFTRQKEKSVRAGVCV